MARAHFSANFSGGAKSFIIGLFCSPLTLFFAFFLGLIGYEGLALSLAIIFILFCLSRASLSFRGQGLAPLFHTHLQLKALGQVSGPWILLSREPLSDFIFSKAGAFPLVKLDPQFSRNLQRIANDISGFYGYANPRISVFSTTQEFFFALNENKLETHLIFSEAILESSSQEVLEEILHSVFKEKISGRLEMTTHLLKQAHWNFAILRWTAGIASPLLRPFGIFGPSIALILNGPVLRLLIHRYNGHLENEIDPWFVEMLSRFSYERLPK